MTKKEKAIHWLSGLCMMTLASVTALACYQMSAQSNGALSAVFSILACIATTIAIAVLAALMFASPRD